MKNARRTGCAKQNFPPLAALIISAAFPFSFLTPVFAEETVAITVQPKDTEVSYPDGASFHVEVDHPENVASYQWEVTEGYNLFILDGESAVTDTLVIPATSQDDPEMFYTCVITDRSGNQIRSEPGRLKIANPDEDITVLYVCDDAVTPGETLDLTGKVYGKGKITFDADGENITFDGVEIDNSKSVYDRVLRPAMGMFFIRRNPDKLEYFFHLKNDCKIVNTYYDREYNAAGVAFNSYFGTGDSSSHPTLVFDGDGSLILRGGTFCMYSDGHYDFYTDLDCATGADYFADGIRCANLYAEKDVSLVMNVNGTGIVTTGDIYAYEGSRISITSTPAEVSVGPTAKDIVFLGGGIHAQGAQFIINGIAKKERFLPNGKFLMMLNGIGMNGFGTASFNNCKVDIELTAEEASEQFCANFSGITGSETGNSLELADGTEFNIRINAPMCTNPTGANIGGVVTVEGGSSLNINVAGTGEAFGMAVGRSLEVTGSSVSSEVVSLDGGAEYGIACDSALISVSSGKNSFSSKTSSGIAFAADTNAVSEEESGYQEGYAPVKIVLSEKASVLTPENGVISTHTIPGYGALIVAETYFSPSDTSKPASEVVIGVKDGIGSGIIIGVVAAAAVIAGVIMMINRKKAA